MMGVREEPDLYFEIGMCGGLAQRGLALADVIEQVYQQFIAHVGHPAEVKGHPLGGHRNRRFVFNEKNWAKLRQELIEGQLDDFRLVSWYKDEEEGPVPCGDVKVLPSLKAPQEEPRIFACSVASGYYRGGLAEAQAWWVDLACTVFQKLGGANGYIAAGGFPWASSYEQSQGLTYRFREIDFQRKLRGHYWGSLLSAGHIAQLGGIERIKREAPCHLVRALSTTEERVYLQLTADLNDTPDRALTLLRTYLDPLLPKASDAQLPEPGEFPGIEESHTASDRPSAGLEVVEAEDCSWDAMAFTLYLDGPLREDVEARLRRLIEAWYTVGAYGGYGVDEGPFSKLFKGVFHNMSNIGFNGDVVEWYVDMGSSSTRAMDVLFACLKRFAWYHEIAMRLVLGYELVA